MAFNYEMINDGSTMLVKDPIYGEITINPPFTDIILTKEMQRLQDISQNGFSVYDFPGLKNNERLSHSVGAFYIMSQIIEHLEKELKRYDIFISKDDKDMALCSMLLHDIGHGPFSHSFESITKYSHEKRTTDILLGDTDVNKILTKTYGKAKLKRIASYIAEIAEYDESEKKETKSSFTKLLKSLISHQLDADRLDYLVRDSYHAGLPSAINYKNVIDALGVSLNSNQEYELLFDKKGLTSIETILIERFQKYRDVYYSKTDGILENNFINILNRYKEVPESVNAELPEIFKNLALNPKGIKLNDFLRMTDKDINKSFEIIKNNCNDQMLKYLCDLPKVLEDYEELENNVDMEMIKTKLDKIFPNQDLTNTNSILQLHKKTKLYKKEESLKINYGNVHKDLAEATPHLIRPDEYLEKNDLLFNPEMLRLEIGMEKEEFDNYKERIKNMIDDINKKPEEFELKYIIDENNIMDEDKVLQVLLENNFKINKIKNKENNDEYYDTKDLSLLSRGGSLRIRKLIQDNNETYKATYKMPTTKGEVYSSREEIEIELVNNSIEELKEKMSEKNIDVNLNNIIKNPLLNSITKRKDIVLEKNGVEVCLSFDHTKYINHVLNEVKSEDSMVEIEALGNVEDRIMLNEINNILQRNFEGLRTNKQSKYERGIQKTREKAKELRKENKEKNDIEYEL